MSTVEMLKAEIREVHAYIKGLDPSSEEYTQAVENLDKLYGRLNEAVKLENESIQADRDSKGKFATDMAGILVPAATFAVWMTRCLIFEETGTPRSYALKTLLQKIRFFK